MKSLFILIFFFSTLSWSQSNSHWTARSQKRESQRWTLQEWLAQKERNQLMDVWLKLNSPSPYELAAGLSYFSYKLDQAQEYSTLRGKVSAYAQIFGLSLEYENNIQENRNDLSGLFNLRLIGNSLQNSNLTFHYGLRTRGFLSGTEEIRLSQQFAELSMKLHFSKFFGTLGSYRYFLPTSESHLGDIEAHSWSAGLFIDFASLRIFAQSQNEIFITNSSNSNRSGIESGIEFIF